MERQKRRVRKMLDGEITTSLLALAFVEIFKTTINFIWYYFLAHLWKKWRNKKKVDPEPEKN